MPTERMLMAAGVVAAALVGGLVAPVVLLGGEDETGGPIASASAGPRALAGSPGTARTCEGRSSSAASRAPAFRRPTRRGSSSRPPASPLRLRAMRER